MEPLGGETEADYCQRLANPGEWGSTAEILALTRVLSRPIRVHTAFGGDELAWRTEDINAACCDEPAAWWRWWRRTLHDGSVSGR